MDSLAPCYKVCNVSSLKSEYVFPLPIVLLGLRKSTAHKRYIGMSLLVFAAIPKYNRQADVRKIHLVLIILDAEKKSKHTIPAGLVSVESLLPGLQMTSFSICHHVPDFRTSMKILSSAKSAFIQTLVYRSAIEHILTCSQHQKGEGCIHSFMRASVSRPDYFPKPPLHPILLCVRLPT